MMLKSLPIYTQRRTVPFAFRNRAVGIIRGITDISLRGSRYSVDKRTALRAHGILRSRTDCISWCTY